MESCLSKVHMPEEIMVAVGIGKAAAYEQLAEEASELAQAALKCARIIRGNNPTPKKYDEALLDLIEEYTDVTCAANVCNVEANDYIYDQKLNRWINRILENCECLKDDTTYKARCLEELENRI